MLEVELRPRAKRDLTSAVIYIGEVLGSPMAAKKLYGDFWDVVERIQESPDIGARFQDPMLEKAGYRRVMVGKYRLFYRVDSGRLIIWRMIHCLQDIDEFEMVDWLD